MTYSGRAVGGPLDGQRVTHDRDVLFVNVRDDIPLNVSGPGAMGNITFRVGAYTMDQDRAVWTWKL